MRPDKRCPKCGEKMKFTYSYTPGQYATANYICPKCESMKKFIKRMRGENNGDKGTVG